MTTTLDPTHSTPPDHTVLGVGARFTLAAMTDRFVDVILGALDDADASALDELTTDEVSTYVAGSETAVLSYVRDVLVAAHRRAPGVHLNVHLLLSRGCPGSVTCDLEERDALPQVGRLELEPTGVRAAAHWSLYPLGEAGHIPAIEKAIADAESDGTLVRVDHHATKLAGDLSAVLQTVANGWVTVGAQVQHVTTHVTLSIASPTVGGAA